MKSLKILFIVFLNIFLTSCNGQEKTQTVTKAKRNIENVTLIISIHGGERSHIIKLQNKVLSYNVGSVDIKDTLLSNVTMKFDKKYKEIIKELKIEDINFLNNSIQQLNNLRFIDSDIVKDNWEYRLYVNGKQVAYAYQLNLNKLPKTIKNVIERIEKIIGKKYELLGMS